MSKPKVSAKSPANVTHDLNKAGFNLTGGQIQSALDLLIHQAIRPIIVHTSVFDLQVVYLLALSARNKKRKLSALPRNEFLSVLSHYLIYPDREEKFALLAASKLERGFIHNFVVGFLKATESYRQMYSDYMRELRRDSTSMLTRTLDAKLRVMEQHVGCSRQHLFPILNSVEDSIALAYEFRNSIVENYMKKAYQQAQAICAYNKNFDFKDVHQNLMASITKAIDKYDATKGALTSYINFWMLNALTSSHSGHEYGIAYTIPQAHKRELAQSNNVNSINFSVSLHTPIEGSEDVTLADKIADDKPTHEEEIIRQEEEDTLRYLIKAADYRGLARLYLDIPEVFSPKEVKKMKKYMAANGLAK